MLVLKKKGRKPMSAEEVQDLIDHQYDEEDTRILEIAGYKK
jgi:hypothetical protein